MLSIKTAHDSGCLFGNSELLCFQDDVAVFRCSCGERFTKFKYKPYSETMKNLMCSACRNASRVQPYQAERQIMRRVQYDARARGLVFDITAEWFSDIIHQPCHYCGSVDMNSSQVRMNHSDGSSFKTSYRYNGIDRMDNAIGYVENNCVPCCFICNRAKREMGYDEFMEWIETMIAYRRGMR